MYISEVKGTIKKVKLTTVIKAVGKSTMPLTL